MPQKELPNADVGQDDKNLDSTTLSIAPGEAEGVILGRYRLLQKTGEGGMGEVWLAEQREPVHRRVAIKLIKAGMNTREVIARFESERQALALMDHPAIARVLDAGSTPRGTPYFVMEYVAGPPIATYCDNHRLSTRERLELFVRVCEGVQHAHQKAIIHRDLKPSNILVTEVDGHPAPKIIDFGVAKALAQKLTAESLCTRVGTLIGTPEYMSPEQALSSGEDIDTRSDVYSLGIILYELLAGMPPLELRNVALDEFLRKLREEDAPKPSTRIRSQAPATSIEVARRRRTEPPTLVRQIRGELDAMVLKALEKDRSRRYPSTSDFAADIERYLNNEAVLAVPPSLAYRARKFARRHRAGLIIASAFTLVLIVAAVFSIRQSIRANKEAAIARAVNDFLQKDMLGQASAYNQSKPDPNITVRTALDRAAQNISEKFAGQPEVEASIRETIGNAYEGLGLYAEAREQMEPALALRLRTLGNENPKTLWAMNSLAWIAEHQGKYGEAETLYSQALGIERRVLGPENHVTLNSMDGLALSYSMDGKYAQAEPLLSEALKVQQHLLGPGNHETLSSMNNLADTYYDQGKYAQAGALWSEGLEIQRRMFGTEHPDTLMFMSNLANADNAEGKYAQAEAVNLQVLEIERRVMGLEHPETLRVTQNLAAVYCNEGKYGQAERLFSQVLEIDRRVMGPEHPDTLVTMDNLADVYLYQGKYAQAEQLFRQTLEIMRRVMGPEHPRTLYTLSETSVMYQREGRYVLAKNYAAQALAGRRRVLGNENPDTMESAADLALAYISQKQFVEAEPLAREAMQTESQIQPDDWQRFRAESLLGASLAGLKKHAEAETHLVEAYEGMLARRDTIAAYDRYNLELTREWLVELYQEWGKPEKATKIAREPEQ
jgi:eukaryotic-like serine/threonine-protein kinase